MSAFDDLVAVFLEELFALQPDVATAVGDHRHDDRWPDMSEAGHAARVAFIDRWEATLAGLDAGSLTADERIDLDLVRGELASFRFAETELREETWSPLLWVYLVGGGLHPLLARDFAPLAVRLASVAGRLEGIPRLLDQARAVIGTHPTRPVAKLHAEVAARRIGGVAQLARDAVAERGGRRGDRSRGGRDPAPPPRGRRRGRRGARGDGPAPRRRGRPERERAGRAGRAAVLGQAPPHAAGPRCDRRRRAGQGRGRVRRRPGRDGPHRPRDLAGVASR